MPFILPISMVSNYLCTKQVKVPRDGDENTILYDYNLTKMPHYYFLILKNLNCLLEEERKIVH